MKRLVNSIIVVLIVCMATPLQAESPELRDTTALEASVRKIKHDLQPEGSNPVSSAVSNMAQEPAKEPELFVRMAKGLGFCLGLLFIGTALVKRYHPGAAMQGRDERRMVILEKLALSPKATLYLVEVDGKQMLVGSGSEALSIQEVPAAEQGSEVINHKDVEDVCQEHEQAVRLRRSA